MQNLFHLQSKTKLYHLNQSKYQIMNEKFAFYFINQPQISLIEIQQINKNKQVSYKFPNPLMLHQQKVQFFNSESSFGSQSSLASSRYFDLTNQVAQQTQTIFLTLKKQFLPTQQLTNFDKIDYLHNRAKIISRDTIPDHLQYLGKISAPKESVDICRECEKRLEKFIKDYETLRRGEMIHKQFYNLYGRSMENNVFFRKGNGIGYNDNNNNNADYNPNNNMLQPDIESIQEAKSTHLRTPYDSKQTARSIVQHSKPPTSDKHVMQLQQQISLMKKRETDLRRQFDFLLTTQKLNCQKRINTFLKVINKKQTNVQSVELQESYRNENIRLGEEILRVLKEKEELVERNGEVERMVGELRVVGESLREELVGYRRLQESRFEEEADRLDQSFQSEQGNNPNTASDDTRNVRKLQLHIKKLLTQRDILKNQLQKQREFLQKQKQHHQSDQSREILRLKSYLQTRNKQNEELHRELDKARVELIQVKQENKGLHKNVSTLKGNSEEMRRTLEGIDLEASASWEGNNGVGNNNNNKNPTINSPTNLITFKPPNSQTSRTLQRSNLTSSSKPNSFEQYQGQGIEGYPYFQLLQKEFKIRFKRACLKNKQLLYKADGLEIGVITESVGTNVVKVLLHVTNSSEGDVDRVNVKVMNPNENKVECEIERVDKLLPNQQVKIPIICTIKNYPIGPVVFALDYTTDTKHDVRLLLPVHIFKCVTIEPRSQDFYKSNKITVKTERKICKDLSSLKEYLNCSHEKEIKVQIKHEHSGSLMFLNAQMKGDEVEIQYEHITGHERFTEYFVKTFKALLQKQN